MQSSDYVLLCVNSQCSRKDITQLVDGSHIALLKPHEYKQPPERQITIQHTSIVKPSQTNPIFVEFRKNIKSRWNTEKKLQIEITV